MTSTINYANNYKNIYTNTYFDYLPKEIMDIINEYNAEHREAYKKVLEELMEIYDSYDICSNCGMDIENEKSKQIYYRSYKRHVACSSYCMWEINYDFRKALRKACKTIL